MDIGLFSLLQMIVIGIFMGRSPKLVGRPEIFLFIALYLIIFYLTFGLFFMNPD